MNECNLIIKIIVMELVGRFLDLRNCTIIVILKQQTLIETFMGRMLRVSLVISVIQIFR